MQRTIMIYDGQCSLCNGSRRIVERLDWLNRVEMLDAQDWQTVHARYPQLDRAAILGLIHVITPKGRVLVGYEGVRHLLGRLPVLAWLYPLLFLPGITWLGLRVYNWVASHRYRFNRILGLPADCDHHVCRPIDESIEVRNR